MAYRNIEEPQLDYSGRPRTRRAEWQSLVERGATRSAQDWERQGALERGKRRAFAGTASEFRQYLTLVSRLFEKLELPPAPNVLSDQEVATRFNQLVTDWKRATMMSSDGNFVLMHPAYYAIIGLGLQALPHIFKDLAAGGGPWFVALAAITRENPVPPSHSNDARKMTTDWIEWGRSHGYLGF